MSASAFTKIKRTEIAGVVLAGGQSRRMKGQPGLEEKGGAKFLLDLNGTPHGKSLLAHVIERLTPQLSCPLAINANIDKDLLSGFELPVVSDTPPDFSGPLAGVLAGLRWAQSLRRDYPELRAIVTAAADSPFLPLDLVSRFIETSAQTHRSLVCAASHGRTHPVFGLWPLELADDLEIALLKEGIRKVDVWTARHQISVTNWNPDGGTDPFFNMNQPEDFTRKH